jgi:hypothetical protein
MRGHDHHCSSPVAERREWEMSPRERRGLDPSSRVLLSGEGQTARRTEKPYNTIFHCHYKIDARGHHFLGLSLQLLPVPPRNAAGTPSL